MDLQGQTQKGSSNLVWYVNPRGGKVFAVGTFYRNWHLDPYGQAGKPSTNPDVQRLTKNAIDELIKH
ncbi:hypothetical protein [Bacillus sp. CECT 9360]|uniref:hypothetical protein n=1 Tax=Bacillus sp. CECT 9360 TaxID=2845821 RepID=UPI001E406E2B|nr:hypothetical protein [Bacillus sp. CECT 9360]